MSKLEEVAAAIAKSDGVVFGSMHISDKTREIYLEQARAALEAIREPTEAQLHAARDWAIQKYGRPIGDDGARGCFLAMIDEILK